MPKAQWYNKLKPIDTSTQAGFELFHKQWFHPLNTAFQRRLAAIVVYFHIPSKPIDLYANGVLIISIALQIYTATKNSQKKLLSSKAIRIMIGKV
jgi:hypothetical protein